MTNLSIFYIVFISQIVLLSVYFPIKLIQRMRFIQCEYPASSHPKLYPKSTHFYQKSIKYYGLSNACLFILGCVIVYYIYEGSLVGEKGINPMLPWGYFMLQMSPLMLLEIFGFKMTKLMKQSDTRTQKSAKLAPRSLFQYISPILFSTVIIVYIIFVLFAFYLEDFKFTMDSKALLASVILLGGYTFYFMVGAWLIYGKKADPYQSQEDRYRKVSLILKTNCYTLIACVFFLGFAVAESTFELKPLMPVAMSFFLQFISVLSTGYMLQNNRLEDINFDVYKRD